MKEITAFESIDRSKSFEEQGLNGTLYWAYQNSKEAGKDLIDFNEVIWDYDIDPIPESCKALGITEFTISSTFSSHHYAGRVRQARLPHGWPDAGQGTLQRLADRRTRKHPGHQADDKGGLPCGVEERLEYRPATANTSQFTIG